MMLKHFGIDCFELSIKNYFFSYCSGIIKHHSERERVECSFSPFKILSSSLLHPMRGNHYGRYSSTINGASYSINTVKVSRPESKVVYVTIAVYLSMGSDFSKHLSKTRKICIEIKTRLKNG